MIACGWYALADANRSDAGHGLTLLFIRIGSEQVLNSCFFNGFMHQRTVHWHCKASIRGQRSGRCKTFRGSICTLTTVSILTPRLPDILSSSFTLVTVPCQI